MVKIDTSGARSFLSDKEWEQAYRAVEEALEKVENRSGEGAEWLGWRDLLSTPNDAELEQIAALAEPLRREADVFVVCGIGGSYLGARAVIEALGTFFPGPDQPEIIYAGHHMSGNYLDQLMRYLSQPKSDGTPKSVYLNVISKSGTTLETALSFRLLRDWFHSTYEEDPARRIICTTSEEGGALNKLVDDFGYRKFVIPEDVGGRFSVLTPVGLLPIAVAGIDIQTLFYGAVNEFEDLESKPEEVLKHAAIRYGLHEKGKAIDLISTFEPELSSFGDWVQQLLGESEGKEGLGIYPATATYSTDLHSLGQLVQEGRRNIMETVIRVRERKCPLTIKKSSGNADTLDYLAGKTFHEINTQALEGTKSAHREGGIPVVELSMQKLNAQQLGALIYYFELFTAVYVYALGINPFDQPGVEAYKKAMYKLLGKQS